MVTGIVALDRIKRTGGRRVARVIATVESADTRVVTMKLADRLHMYEEVTAERALNEACLHLLTTLGMNNLYPGGAQQFRHMPTPSIRFQVPQVDTAGTEA
jgi:hypothetical protein